MTYFGRYVLTMRTVREVKHLSDPALQLLHNPTGRDIRDRRMNRPAMYMMLEAVLSGREAIDEFRTFLEGREGRLVPFWLPTWDYDVRIVGEYEGAVTVFNIRRTEFVENYVQGSLHRARRYLLFYHPDSLVANEVFGAQVIDDDLEELTVSEEIILTDVYGNDIYETICFLSYCRLDADRIEIRWLGNDKAVATLPVKIIEYEEASG